MSSEATINEFVSKPKIHRMPAQAVSSSAESESESLMMLRALWVFGAISLSVLAFLAYQNHKKSQAEPAPVAATKQVNDAELADLTNSSIYIKGDEGIIVGQMAKIPQEQEKITNIKSISDIDRPAGRDLLAIISKY